MGGGRGGLTLALRTCDLLASSSSSILTVSDDDRSLPSVSSIEGELSDSDLDWAVVLPVGGQEMPVTNFDAVVHMCVYGRVVSESSLDISSDESEDDLSLIDSTTKDLKMPVIEVRADDSFTATVNVQSQVEDGDRILLDITCDLSQLNNA